MRQRAGPDRRAAWAAVAVVVAAIWTAAACGAQEPRAGTSVRTPTSVTPASPAAASPTSRRQAPDELLNEVCAYGIFTRQTREDEITNFRVSADLEGRLRNLAKELSGTKYADEAASIEAWLDGDRTLPTAIPAGNGRLYYENYRKVREACLKLK